MHFDLMDLVSQQVEEVLLVGAVLLVLCVAASQLSARLGVPALLFFLGLGMLAGDDTAQYVPWLNIAFADHTTAYFVGSMALVFILYAGGLDTKWARVRPVLLPGLSLATVGVVCTALLVGAFVHLALGSTWLQGLVLGAVISSTDAAAVFSVLRSRSVPLEGTLQPTLELESGSNDPVAVFLTVGMLGLVVGDGASLASLVVTLVLQMGIGAVCGLLLGRAARWVLTHWTLAVPGLYPTLSIGLMLAVFGLTDLAQGNGFLAIYVAGLVVGNGRFRGREELLGMHDALSWLMQVAMFLMLGLLVFPRQLFQWEVILPGLAVALFLMFVARPVSVLISLPPPWRDIRPKAFIAWGGLKGAVPIILATFPFAPSLNGKIPIELARPLFNLVFFVVLLSVLLQGTTLSAAARWLGVRTQSNAT